MAGVVCVSILNIKQLKYCYELFAYFNLEQKRERQKKQEWKRDGDGGKRQGIKERKRDGRGGEGGMEEREKKREKGRRKMEREKKNGKKR